MTHPAAAPPLLDVTALRRDLVRAVSRVCPGWLAADRDDLVQAAVMRVVQRLEASSRTGEGNAPLASSYFYKVAHDVVRFNVSLDDLASGASGSVTLQFGLIAEEVDETIPELVVHAADGTPKTVRYHQLPPLLLAEVQRLERERSSQAERIESLERDLAALRTLVDAREHR